MKRLPLVLLLLLSVCARPSQAQQTKTQTLSACQQGVATVSSGHPQLQTWANFYRQHARPQAAATPSAQAFTVLALTEVELAQQRRIKLFEFDPTQTRLYLMTVAITPAWRGLGCLRETVIAKDRLTGVLPQQASPTAILSSKVKAYQAQLTAANHITKGAFAKTVQRLLAQRRYHTSEGLLVPNSQALRSLDRLFPQPAVLSPHERGLRDELYLVAFNFARRQSAAQRAAILSQLY